MGSRLSRHFQRTRKARGLRIADLARLVSYTNVTKGCNRILLFEERGGVRRDLLRKLAEILGIDEATIEALVEQDREDAIRRWNEWADQPMDPYLIVPIRPGMRKPYYRRETLPRRVGSLADAERYASRIAWAKHCDVGLQWSRRLLVWFTSTGEVAARRVATPDPNFR